jgi:Mrp family chromosome partitioning ATPase
VAVDAQVVLVDADLRRPVLHSRLRVNREPGLTDVLRGTPLAKAVHAVDSFQNLRVVPSGTAVSDTVGALGGRALHDVLEEIDDAELVIVDTPPGDYADALAIAAQCDAALLVLDAQTTRRRSTKQFLEALERTGASLIGVILNNAPVSKRAASYDRS